MRIIWFVFIFFCFTSLSCASFSSVIDTTKKILTGKDETEPSLLEIDEGLKEALQSGIKEGIDHLSKPNGYLDNIAVKIGFPKEAKNVENVLRSIGLGVLCDEAIKRFNMAASASVIKAAPIFVKAIGDMTFDDAKEILLGNDHAATNYLRKTTGHALKNACRPIVKKNLSKVKADVAWSELVTKYNQIPTVQPIETDIDVFVTQKAVDGLFFVLAKEEAGIRRLSVKRATDLLKKVFGWRANRAD